MKITFILGSMGKGGAERVISILSREYAQKGWETEIIMLLSGKVEYKLHETTKVIDLSGGCPSRIRKVPYWLKNIRHHIRNSKPDVILSFVARINIIVQVACLGLGKKILVSERNDPKCDGRSIFVKILTKILYPLSNGVVFQTKRAASYFKSLKNAVIIPNPIEIKITAKENRKKKIVNVGRLAKQKNQKLLIDAFSEVHKKHPQYILEIYGEGELREELQLQIDTLNLSESVFLMGNKENVHECISDAEFFVLSSDYEGLSNALLEAMMMGIACISTNCAGADEVIENGRNGLIVDVGDCKGLANAMKKLIEDSSLANDISNCVSESIESFETGNVVKKWMKVIEG